MATAARKQLHAVQEHVIAGVGALQMPRSLAIGWVSVLLLPQCRCIPSFGGI